MPDNERRRMTVTLLDGETITQDGEQAGYPIVQLDVNDERLIVDIACELPDGEDGEKRVVNAMMPWDDLEEAVAFLRGELVSARRTT